MRFFIFGFIIALFPVSLLAESVPLENEQQSSDQRRHVLPPQENGANKSTTKESLPWPRPYVPSEEISADSTVPFPADI